MSILFLLEEKDERSCLHPHLLMRPCSLRTVFILFFCLFQGPSPKYPSVDRYVWNTQRILNHPGTVSVFFLFLFKKGHICLFLFFIGVQYYKTHKPLSPRGGGCMPWFLPQQQSKVLFDEIFAFSSTQHEAAALKHCFATRESLQGAWGQFTSTKSIHITSNMCSLVSAAWFENSNMSSKSDPVPLNAEATAGRNVICFYNCIQLFVS